MRSGRVCYVACRCTREHSWKISFLMNFSSPSVIVSRRIRTSIRRRSLKQLLGKMTTFTESQVWCYKLKTLIAEGPWSNWVNGKKTHSMLAVQYSKAASGRKTSELCRQTTTGQVLGTVASTGPSSALMKRLPNFRQSRLMRLCSAVFEFCQIKH